MKIITTFYCLLIAFMLSGAYCAGADYQRALPGYQFSFPRDHGSHEAFRTEWWYYTGNLATTEGREFGFELTFFRQRLLPPGNTLRAATPLAPDQLFLAHFAISDIQKRQHANWERLGRQGFNQGFASTTTLDVRMGDWHAALRPTENAPETMHIAAFAPASQDAALSLTLTPARPFVIHGEQGVHQKAEQAGQASHYISFTRLATSGQITWRGQTFHVTGLSWMDHEFGSGQLADDDEGWDWFALQLDSGDDLMLYQIRRKGGGYNPWNAGTHVDPTGAKRTLPGKEYTIRATGEWTSPQTKATYPMGWEIELPGEDSKLKITPRFEAQEMRTRRSTGTVYWEGAVGIAGTWRGRPVEGKGYVELVGYAGRMFGL